MRKPTFTLGTALVATGAGPVFEVPDQNLDQGTVYVYGTLTSLTYAIEVSPDGGTTWLTAQDAGGNSLAGKTAVGSYLLRGAATQLRLNVTGYVSGSLNAKILFPNPYVSA